MSFDDDDVDDGAESKRIAVVAPPRGKKQTFRKKKPHARWVIRQNEPCTEEEHEHFRARKKHQKNQNQQNQQAHTSTPPDREISGRSPKIDYAKLNDLQLRLCPTTESTDSSLPTVEAHPTAGAPDAHSTDIIVPHIFRRRRHAPL